MYVYDCNDILTTSIKSKSDNKMIQDLKKCTTEFKIRGINLVCHFMENEASTALKLEMTTMEIKYQLFPPSNHRANNSERAIQMFKNNFIARLCSVDKDLHLQWWKSLLKQATISIKMLSQSIIYTHLSDYTHIFGEFNYSCTPLDPPGKREVINNRPNNIS